MTLYRNDGDGRFENATRTALGPTPFGTVGARAFDYDGDGLLDLFLVDMHSDMWMLSNHDPKSIDEHKKYATFFGAAAEAPGFDPRQARHFEARMGIRRDEVFYGNALYRNKGDGTFEELSDKAGTETFWPWGVAAGDFDNDGFTDVFVPSGMGYPFFHWRNYLLMNNRDGTFTDRSRQVGLDPPPGGKFWGKIAGRPAVRSARSAAVLDFDADGRLDVVVSNFNDRPNLFRNRWPKRAYVAFRLEGTRSNRDAIGALLRLTVDKKVLVRMVHAAGGYLAQSTKTVHFGLAPGAQVEKCEIRWPSGQTQILSSPKLNRTHTVKEPR
jgi:hypothetical protein